MKSTKYRQPFTVPPDHNGPFADLIVLHAALADEHDYERELELVEQDLLIAKLLTLPGGYMAVVTPPEVKLELLFWNAAVCKAATLWGWKLHHQFTLVNLERSEVATPYAPFKRRPYTYVHVFLRPGGEPILGAADQLQTGEWERAMSTAQYSIIDGHAPLSVNVAERLIKVFSRPGSVVIDAYPGTGAFEIACQNWQRHYVAFNVPTLRTEKNNGYRIAAAR